MAVGIAVLVSNATAAGWGAVGWLRHNARAAITFWPLLRVAQATVVVQATVGLLLLARGASAPDGLHVIYGIVPLFVSLISEGMRAQEELYESLARERTARIKRVARTARDELDRSANRVLAIERALGTAQDLDAVEVEQIELTAANPRQIDVIDIDADGGIECLQSVGLADAADKDVGRVR